MNAFQGIFPALPTPFVKGGTAIDYDALCGVLDYLIENRAHGVFAGGTTGEGPSIPPSERNELFSAVSDHAAGRIKIIFQVGHATLNETLEIAEHARKLKPDALAIFAPWFYGCDNEALIQYASAVAEAVDGDPLFLYNIPQRTGNYFHADVVKVLLERHPNICGIKESGSFEHFEKLIGLQSDAFRVVCGMDTHDYDAYRKGCRMIVSSFANWMPDVFVAFHEAALAGDWDKAKALQGQIIKTLKPADNANLLANTKAGLRMKGVEAGYCRPPVRDLSDAETAKLHTDLKAVGFLK